MLEVLGGHIVEEFPEALDLLFLRVVVDLDAGFVQQLLRSEDRRSRIAWRAQ